MKHSLEPSTVSTTDTIIEVDPEESDTPQETLSPTSRFRLHPHHKPHIHHQRVKDPLASGDFIPKFPPDKRRTLVLCFDGTGDQFCSDNSNIVQFVTMLNKGDKEKQLVYYQAGVGTYVPPVITTPFAPWFFKLTDMMFAWSLRSHVIGGYKFLMQHYRKDDKICLFGFSRGAYTARSLAGMLHKVGLLPADNHQQVPFAYKMYTRTDDIGWAQSSAFKAAFSIDVKIEFVGVWDTVDSVGAISRRLPFTTSNTIVRTFRHAVSLDEHRSKFKANLWHRPTKELTLSANITQVKREGPQAIGNDDGNGNGSGDSNLLLKSGNITTTSGLELFSVDIESDKVMDQQEIMYSGGNDRPTDVEEVWFAGCHCDIGGGSVENGTRYSLARIPLRWMIRECFKAETGILFNKDLLRGIGLDHSTLWPCVKRRPPLEPILKRAGRETIPKAITTKALTERLGSFFRTSASRRRAAMAAAIQRAAQNAPFINEEEEELKDALSPMYDELELTRRWWFCEIIPLSMVEQKIDNQMASYIGINLGAGRDIPDQEKVQLKFHQSVKLRMEAQGSDGKQYKPRAFYISDPEYAP